MVLANSHACSPHGAHACSPPSMRHHTAHPVHHRTSLASHSCSVARAAPAPSPLRYAPDVGVPRLPPHQLQLFSTATQPHASSYRVSVVVDTGWSWLEVEDKGKPQLLSFKI